MKCPYQFFAPIKNSKLKIGLEVKVREAKMLINQLKEDKQTRKRNFTWGDTKLPNEITPFCIKWSCWQAPTKSESLTFRNYLISVSKAIIEKALTDVGWIYDSMDLVWAFTIKLIRKELVDTISRSCNNSRIHASSISENNYGRVRQ